MSVDTKTLRELLSKATPGEWRTQHCSQGEAYSCWCRVIEGDGSDNNACVAPSGSVGKKDASFITAAKNSMAALLDAAEELEKARAVVAAAREMPRRTPAAGGAGSEYGFRIAAADVWALDRALKEYDALKGDPS